MEVLETIFNVSLVAATLRTTTPILLVALGGTFTTKAGISVAGSLTDVANSSLVVRHPLAPAMPVQAAANLLSLRRRRGPERGR